MPIVAASSELTAGPIPTKSVEEQAELELLWRRLLALACVTMLPGSYDKRFVKNLVARGKPDGLTEKQRNLVGQMAYRYRRQMPAHLVPERVQLPAKAKR